MNLREVLDRLNGINSGVSSFSLEENLDWVLTLKDVIYEVIDHRVKLSIPKGINQVINNINEKAFLCKEVIDLIYLDAGMLTNVGYDKIIKKIEITKNIDEVNSLLKEFIISMDHLGVILTYKNFNYSFFTLKYMGVFFEQMHEKNYLNVMEKYFNKLNNQCRNLLCQISICLKCLVKNNGKIISKHVNRMIDKRLEELHLTKDNVLNTYFDLTKKELDLKSIDPFLIIKHFRNNKHELRQYQEGTDRFNEAMGSIANISEYERLNLSDKMIFLGNINVLVNDINAYELVLRFKGVFSYVKEVLNSKDNYMEAYKLKSKQIKALEREKNAIDRQLYSLMRRKKLNKTSKSKVNLINNSLRAYSVKLADKIDEIDRLYAELSILHFKVDLVNKLSRDTSIYNVICYVSNYSSWLFDMLSKNGSAKKSWEMVDKFCEIRFMPNFMIMKKVAIENYERIQDIIENKYRASELNVRIPDNDGEFYLLRKRLNFLVDYYNILKCELSIDDIELLLEFS